LFASIRFALPHSLPDWISSEQPWEATWVLEENAAQRASRFAAASNSVNQLLSLIDEFPKSAEAADARKRIPGVQHREIASPAPRFLC
jgi:hypothetical protein